jgi:poly(A) polymerase
MMQATDRADLRTLYERAADAPVAVGDTVSDRRVVGFYSTGQDGPAVDHVLLDGEDRSSPPDRPLTCRGDLPGLERTGSSPVAGLRPEHLQLAPAHLGTAMEAALDSQPGGSFVREMLDRIASLRHHAWLVGGSVRDLLSPGPAGAVQDFDVTGTIGPGCLDSMVRLRRRTDAGDYKASLSPRNIWSVKSRLGGPRLVEYKPLTSPDSPPHVFGGGLDDDVRTRDLTFNALYYDRHHGVLADPCGQGRSHLDARVIDTPNASADVVEKACVVIRSLKFRLRYQSVDSRPIVAWIMDNLPDDFAARITEPGWKRLIGTRHRSGLSELADEEEIAVVGEFGEKPVRLVKEIRTKALEELGGGA